MERYCLSAVVGFPLLFAYVLTFFVKQDIARILVLCYITGQFAVTTMGAFSNRYAGYSFTVASDMIPKENQLPIVVADPITYVPSLRYADASIVPRLVYLVDLKYSTQLTNLFRSIFWIVSGPFCRERWNSYSDFLRTHQEFLLYTTNSVNLEWLPDQLVTDGNKLEWVTQEGDDILFKVTVCLQNQRPACSSHRFQNTAFLRHANSPIPESLSFVPRDRVGFPLFTFALLLFLYQWVFPKYRFTERVSTFWPQSSDDFVLRHCAFLSFPAADFG